MALCGCSLSSQGTVHFYSFLHDMSLQWGGQVSIDPTLAHVGHCFAVGNDELLSYVLFFEQSLERSSQKLLVIQ